MSADLESTDPELNMDIDCYRSAMEI